MGALLSLVLTAGYGVLSPTPQKTVVFDKGRAISAFAGELERRQVSEKQGQVLTRRFVRAMNDTLKEQSLKRNWVIMQKESVYAGGWDKTDALLKLIARKMKKMPSEDVTSQEILQGSAS